MEKEPNPKLVSTYFCGKTVEINEKYLDKIQAVNLFLVLHRPDIIAKITRVDSYNKRRMTWNPLKWSYHAFAQALDCNPPQFYYSQKKYPLPQWYNDLVIIMKSFGWRWGGDWWSIFDPMHFEIGKRE